MAKKNNILKVTLVAVAVVALVLVVFGLNVFRFNAQVTNGRDVSSTEAVNFGSLEVTSFSALLKGEKYTCNKEDVFIVTSGESFVENTGLVVPSDEIGSEISCGDGKGNACHSSGVCGRASGYNTNVCIVCVVFDEEGKGRITDISSGQECTGRLYVQA